MLCMSLCIRAKFFKEMQRRRISAKSKRNHRRKHLSMSVYTHTHTLAKCANCFHVLKYFLLQEEEQLIVLDDTDILQTQSNTLHDLCPPEVKGQDVTVSGVQLEDAPSEQQIQQNTQNRWNMMSNKKHYNVFKIKNNYIILFN